MKITGNANNGEIILGIGGPKTDLEKIRDQFSYLNENFNLAWEYFNGSFETVLEKSTDQMKSKFEKIKYILFQRILMDLDQLYTDEYREYMELNIETTWEVIDGKEVQIKNPYHILLGQYFFLPGIVYSILTENLNELDSIKDNLEKQINKRRTYPKQLMDRIHELYTKSVPKITQQQAVILANRELKIYNEDELLLPNSDLPQQLLIDIVNSYKSQKKDL